MIDCADANRLTLLTHQTKCLPPVYRTRTSTNVNLPRLCSQCFCRWCRTNPSYQPSPKHTSNIYSLGGCRHGRQAHQGVVFQLPVTNNSKDKKRHGEQPDKLADICLNVEHFGMMGTSQLPQFVVSTIPRKKDDGKNSNEVPALVLHQIRDAWCALSIYETKD